MEKKNTFKEKKSKRNRRRTKDERGLEKLPVLRLMMKVLAAAATIWPPP